MDSQLLSVLVPGKTSSTAYEWLTIAAISASLLLWAKLARRDSRLLAVYIGALAGAFLGAKVVYLASEGWLHWHEANRWLILATGKSITGALLGGYAGVEVAKRLFHYPYTTGDWFALVAPVGIMIGRVGCMLHGCCLGLACEPHWYTITDAMGQARWPASQVEFAFNLLALGIVVFLRCRRLFPEQHFHLYLMAYGAFRFLHELLRATPKIAGFISGYQVAAVAVALLGLVGFETRRRSMGPVQCSGAKSRPAHNAHAQPPASA